MTEASRIMEEAKERVHELQTLCPHEERTDWFRPMWASGHYHRYEIKTCKRCDKQMERRDFKLIDPNLGETQA